MTLTECLESYGPLYDLAGEFGIFSLGGPKAVICKRSLDARWKAVEHFDLRDHAVDFFPVSRGEAANILAGWIETHE